MTMLGQPVPTFRTLDRQGVLVATVTPNFPDVSRTWVSSFDRSSDGSIVFSGGSYSTSGEASPFVALISPDGHSSRIVRTAPYFISQLSVAPDGTFWTLGYEMINGQLDAPGVNPNADVIRHFNKSGELLGSTGGRKQFSTRLIANSRIVATKDRLGWYGTNLGEGSYLELSTATMAVTHKYPGFPAEIGKHPGLLTDSVLTDSGVTVLTFEDHKTQHRTTYVLDREKSSWVPVAVPQFAGIEPSIQGSDGEQLVFDGIRLLATRFFTLDR